LETWAPEPYWETLINSWFESPPPFPTETG